jgi:hypothetical protein
MIAHFILDISIISNDHNKYESTYLKRKLDLEYYEIYQNVSDNIIIVHYFIDCIYLHINSY